MSKNDSLYGQVVACIQKEAQDRSSDEIEAIYPWFFERVKFFHSLKSDVTKDVIRNCEFAEKLEDEIIIRQFDKGDCFYIILAGRVSIYVNTEAIHDDLETAAPQTEAGEVKQTGDRKVTNRSKLGNFVGNLEGGASFGELALINKDCVRNASIVADTTTHLAIVNRATYNRSLRDVHEAEFRERITFVNTCPIFTGWIQSLKKQAAMSLVKKSLPFQSTLCEQGKALDGLTFLLQGEIKLQTDVVMHPKQYPNLILAPIDPRNPDSFRNLESTARFQDNSSPMIMNSNVRLPRRMGYTISERVNALRSVEISIAGPGIVIGELEYGLDLPTYCQTAICVSSCEAYILDSKNFDRLIQSRRNPHGIKLIRDRAEKYIMLHYQKPTYSRIPLISHFAKQYLDKAARAYEEERERAFANRMEINQPKGYETFIPQRGALIDEYGPGTVFYRNKQRRLFQEKMDKLHTAGPFGTVLRPDESKLNRSMKMTTQLVVLPSSVSDMSNKRFDTGSSMQDLTSSGRTMQRTGSAPHSNGFKSEVNIIESPSLSALQSKRSAKTKSMYFYDWETSPEYIAQLEGKLKSWYRNLDSTTDLWSANMISPLKDSGEPKLVRRLLPGKRVLLRPVENKLEECEPMTIELMDENGIDSLKLDLRDIKYDDLDLDESEQKFHTGQTENQDYTSGMAKDNEEVRFKPREDAAEVIMELQQSIKQLFDKIETISLSYGHSIINQIDSPKSATTRAYDSVSLNAGKSTTRTLSAAPKSRRNNVYTADEYKELQNLLHDELTRARKARL